jgi:hypothetical protein
LYGWRSWVLGGWERARCPDVSGRDADSSLWLGIYNLGSNSARGRRKENASGLRVRESIQEQSSSAMWFGGMPEVDGVL